MCRVQLDQLALWIRVQNHLDVRWRYFANLEQEALDTLDSKTTHAVNMQSNANAVFLRPATFLLS